MIKNEKLTISGECSVTGDMYSTAKVNREDWERFKKGGKILDCLPYLSENDREFLVSGISPAGFNQLCGTDDKKPKEEDIDDLDQNNQPFAD